PTVARAAWLCSPGRGSPAARPAPVEARPALGAAAPPVAAVASAPAAGHREHWLSPASLPPYCALAGAGLLVPDHMRSSTIPGFSRRTQAHICLGAVERFFEP